MTSARPAGAGDIGVGQLEFWVQKLFRIDGDKDRCIFELADLGVVLKTSKPKVSVSDSPKIIRLKERLLALHRERESVLRQLERSGARLYDSVMMEVIVKGGPEPGAWLSWQPGEPRIAWWRSSCESGSSPSSELCLSSERRLLPGFDLEDVQPIIH